MTKRMIKILLYVLLSISLISVLINVICYINPMIALDQLDNRDFYHESLGSNAGYRKSLQDGSRQIKSLSADWRFDPDKMTESEVESQRLEYRVIVYGGVKKRCLYELAIAVPVLVLTIVLIQWLRNKDPKGAGGIKKCTDAQA